MVAQTVPVIIGEAVAAGLIVGVVTWAVRKLLRREMPVVLPVAAAVVSDNLTNSPVAVVGNNATNSPVAVGMVVHQSSVYNTLVPVETVKPAPQRDSIPSPEEVVDYYDRLTPYQRNQSQENHKGINVHWRVVYRSIFDLGEDGSVRILATPKKDLPFVGIYLEVNLTDHPQFKIAHKGEEFWLDGTIIKAGGDFIFIDCTAIRWGGR
jgi:hypothetical protein